MKLPKSFALITVLIILLGYTDLAQAFYNPETGSFLNRDPIEERGEENLYGFVRNDGVNKIDVLGLTLESSTFDPSRLPLEPYMAHPSIGGYTEYDWIPGLSREDDGDCYYARTKPKFAVRLYKNKSSIEPSSGGPNNESTEQHERHHARITQEWWNLFVELGRVYEDVPFCEKECRELAVSIIANLSAWYDGEARVANGEFDKRSYHGGSSQARIARGQRLIATHQPQYELALQKFLDKGCFSKTCSK
jgi:hypothetical protein